MIWWGSDGGMFFYKIRVEEIRKLGLIAKVRNFKNITIMIINNLPFVIPLLL